MTFSNNLISVNTLDNEIRSGTISRTMSFSAKNSNDVISKNFFGELFFDYLETIYEHTLVLENKLMRRYYQFKKQYNDQHENNPKWMNLKLEIKEQDLIEF